MQIAPVLVACLAAGCLAAVPLVVLLAWQRRRAATARQQAAAAREQAAALRGRLAAAGRREQLMVEEIHHLAATRLPALAKALRHAHVLVPEPRHDCLTDTEGGQALSVVLAEASAALVSERRRVDGAAQAAMRGATTKLQTMCYQVQTTVDAMLHTYDDPDLAEQLAALDYLNEQILRRLQVTRVLCGAGAGLVRTHSPLRALVMGASSRIPSYERVQIVDHLSDAVAVADRAAEPVAIVVAELLANAVHHSHGTLSVEVSLHQAHNGAVVVINDAGIGMNSEEFTKARRLLTGTEELILAELGDPPRSGFAAVGRLCRQFGISVSIEPSHYGGVKAVVFVPAELLTSVSPEEVPPIPAPIAPPVPNQPRAPVAPVAVPAPPPPAPPPAAVPSAPPPGPAIPPPGPAVPAPSGSRAPAVPFDGPAADDDSAPPLPQRRHRRATLPRTASGETPVAEELTPASAGVAHLRDPAEAAARMGALQRGTARGRAAGAAAGTEGPA